MRKINKIIILSLTAYLPASIGLSPAATAVAAETIEEENYSISSFAHPASKTLEAQHLVTPDIALTTENNLMAFNQASVERMTLPHNYDVEASIALALSEVGTSRPTGWSQGGECIVSVGRWLEAGGAELAGVDPRYNYNQFTEVPLDEVLPGDVIQYEYMSDPTAWASGVHTLLVVGLNDDGTFKIVESNNPRGSGLVSKNDSWTPNPPAGFRAVAWRF